MSFQNLCSRCGIITRYVTHPYSGFGTRNRDVTCPSVTKIGSGIERRNEISPSVIFVTNMGQRMESGNKITDGNLYFKYITYIFI